jgi:hypothetical protein
MSIESKNKLIAEFSGLGHDVGGTVSFYYSVGEEYPYSGDICTLENICDEITAEVEEFGSELISEVVSFHNSFDWLIPVVQKIYNLEIENELVWIIRDALADASLQRTYDAVVEFIIWYNKNN